MLAYLSSRLFWCCLMDSYWCSVYLYWRVSVEALAVTAKVEAIAVSVSLQFLDLFRPSVLLQLQDCSACCRWHSQHSCCTSAADLVSVDHGPQRCIAVPRYPAVVVAGTVKYVDLSDVSSLQPVAFLSFHSTYYYRPSFNISPSSNVVAAPASIAVSAVATNVCYSTCFSIGCSASHRNQVGALVMYLRPPVLLLSVVATLQPSLPRLKLLLSLLLFRDLQYCYCSSISCSACWLNTGQGFSFLSAFLRWTVNYRHLSDVSRAAIAICSYISRKHRAFVHTSLASIERFNCFGIAVS